MLMAIAALEADKELTCTYDILCKKINRRDLAYIF